VRAPPVVKFPEILFAIIRFLSYGRVPICGIFFQQIIRFVKLMFM